MDNNAAHNLLNQTLKSGWIVKSKPERDPNQSGSNFSVGYLVEKQGHTCFLKAFDFAGFLSIAHPKDGEDCYGKNKSFFDFFRANLSCF